MLPPVAIPATTLESIASSFLTEALSSTERTSSPEVKRAGKVSLGKPLGTEAIPFANNPGSILPPKRPPLPPPGKILLNAFDIPDTNLPIAPPIPSKINWGIFPIAFNRLLIPSPILPTILDRVDPISLIKLSKRFLKELIESALTMYGGKLFQLSIVLYEKKLHWQRFYI